MLEIKNLTKMYGEKIGIKNLNLHIKPGEIYGFIGHNGAGKTTTLKACAGIHKFDKGEIIINGNSIEKNPIECKADFAYIPDNPDLYDYMTGIQFINFVCDVFKVSAQDRTKKIHDLATTFEIEKDLSTPISEYSHGMKQKVALISAWVHNPKLIMMDEPFVGLDPSASFKLKEMMNKHCEDGGAIFFSTHVLEVAEKLCTKIAIVKGGLLIKSGTMEEVKGDESLEEVFLELEK